MLWYGQCWSTFQLVVLYCRRRFGVIRDLDNTDCVWCVFRCFDNAVGGCLSIRARLAVYSPVRARIIHNERESGRILAVSFLLFASEALWTRMITLNEVSCPYYRGATKCATNVYPSFPTSFAPSRTFRHAHHSVELLRTHVRTAKMPSKEIATSFGHILGGCR